MLLVTAVDPWNPPARLAEGPAPALALVRDEAERLLQEAAGQWSDAAIKTTTVEGWAPRALLDCAEGEGSELILVGMHGRRRGTAFVLGSVATAVLHEARCSVFLARPARDAARFPRMVVVGVDGSAQSMRAAAVADDLVNRFDADRRTVAATGAGRGLLRRSSVDLEAAHAAVPALEVDSRAPVKALVAAVGDSDADLLIVGARGLRGLRAIGSVSERVAHEAACSVLVVRS